MATASQVTEEYETINCPVCITKFDNPRILPCLHTICEKCLRVNIESQGQSSAQFLCPICKTPIVPSDIDITVDKWICEFIPDRAINSLVDTDESSDNNDARCDECQREGENTTAEIWCADCQEELCDPCAKYHKRNKASRHHTTVTFHEAAKTGRPAGTYHERTCARHPGKPLELFCVDDRELFCVLCFASNHRECNNIRGIDDVVQEQTKELAFDKIFDDFMEIKPEVNKIISCKKENVVQLTEEKEKIINDMDIIVERIIAKLNELKKSFREDVEHLYEEEKRSLMKYHKFIMGFLANISNSCRVLANVKDHGSPRQKFVLFETLRSQITSHHQQFKNDLKNDASVHLTLKPNTILQELEKSIDSLGEVEVTSKTYKILTDSFNNIEDNIQRLNSRSQLMCTVPMQKSDKMTSSWSLVKTVTWQNLGTVTEITGGTFLRDGRLVMADNRNCLLLQLDDDYSIVREHKMDGPPRDVAAGTNENEIYISIYIHPDNYIYRSTLDTGLTITQRIKSTRGTWGIAVIGDTIIAGTADAVLLLSQDGSTVKSLSKPPRNCYVAVSHTPLSYYYGDGDYVVSRGLDGKELFRYNNDKLKYVTGICVHNNNVYVCGRHSHNVHQISSNGQRSRILLDKLHSISRPRAVLFNQQKNELIVTSDGENTVLEVYRSHMSV